MTELSSTSAIGVSDIKKNSDVYKEMKASPPNKCRTLSSRCKLLVIIMCFILASVMLGLPLIFWRPATLKTGSIEDSTNRFRLPDHIVPRHYILEIQPYLVPGNFTFDGKVEITFDCVKETDALVLHSSGLSLNIRKVQVRSVDGVNYKVAGFTFNNSNEFLKLKLSDNLRSGNDYRLFIAYNGTMHDDGKGIYVSTYEDEQRPTQYVASTQLQPMFARKVFPCFDEPALKATFDITVVRWKNVTSLSNMPRVKTESRGEHWEADIYATSMKMPTELVAFVVGEYIGVTKGKITFWSFKDKISLVSHALDLAVSLLQFYEELLDMKYEAPKLDMVTITLKNSRGMENWGLITVSPSLLLDGQNYQISSEARKNTLSVVAHEIAHQWFGNLVTPKWWSDIWLSEGLSSYMEYVAAASHFPEYNEINKTVLLANTYVFRKDCLTKFPSTVWKNITGKVSFVLDNTFDEVTYFKGSIITRMVHYILGDEKFWKLLSKYLKENAYGNVDENDFWRYMTENPGVNMTKRMTSWTHLSGLPVVSVKRNYSDKTATFSQISCRVKMDKRHKSYLWHIPISFSSSKNPGWNPPIATWMSTRNTTIDVSSSGQDWILVNGQSIGNYIVNYDKRNWKLLAEQLKIDHEIFSAEQRYKLLADANNLRELGYSDLTEDVLLDLSTYLHRENILSVFSPPVLNFIRECLFTMKLAPLNQNWKDFVVHLFGPIYHKIGWENAPGMDDGHISKLRYDALYWLCDQNYETCITEAERKFHIWKTYGEARARLTTVSLSRMMCTVASFEDSAYSNYLYELYLKRENTSILFALGCSSDASIIKAVFEEFLKLEDTTFLVFGTILARNKKHWPMLFTLIDERFQKIADDEKLLKRILRLLGTFKHDLQTSEKILEIMKRNLPPLSNWRKKKVEDLINRHEKLIPKIKRKQDSINKWLLQKQWLIT